MKSRRCAFLVVALGLIVALEIVPQMAGQTTTPPSLTIQKGTTGHIRLSWPAVAGFVLERCESFSTPSDTNSWTLIPPPYQAGVVISNGVAYGIKIAVQIPSTTNAFYRLRQP